MAERTVSATALGTAFVRAAHQVVDAHPLVFEDPVAVRLLGADGLEQIHAAAEGLGTPERRALRTQLVLRARYTEDRLQEAVERGVTQYAILGAGLDTFALRQPDWATSLSILELDQPETQEVKRDRLREAELEVADNVSFASVDFEAESLREVLERSALSLDEATFFSWLGVTVYLEERAIDAVLGMIGELPVGSEVVLTFAPRGSSAERWGPVDDAYRDERWVSTFTRPELEAKLASAGFSAVEFLSPDEAEARYFHDRPADLPIPTHTTLVATRV